MVGTILQHIEDQLRRLVQCKSRRDCNVRPASQEPQRSRMDTISLCQAPSSAAALAYRSDNKHAKTGFTSSMICAASACHPATLPRSRMDCCPLSVLSPPEPLPNASAAAVPPPRPLTLRTHSLMDGGIWTGNQWYDRSPCRREGQERACFYLSLPLSSRAVRA